MLQKWYGENLMQKRCILIVDHFNSLWTSDVIWRYRTSSTLTQIMACCLMAPSHCLTNAGWLNINEVLKQTPDSNFTWSKISIHKLSLKVALLKLKLHFPGGNELIMFMITLTQIMACCLMAPSHCLTNAGWLNINEVLKQTPDSNFTRSKISIHKLSLKVALLKLKLHFPGDNELIMFMITLTHWGRVTHICVSNPTIIGSDNGLSPSRRQAIIGTNAGILLIQPLGTNFSEMLIEIYIFSLKKMHSKWSSGKWRPCCPGLNVLMVLYDK